MPIRRNFRPKSAEAAGENTGKIKVSDKASRTVDGIVFKSKWESRVYKRLKEVVPPELLSLQPKFLLQEGFRGRDGGWIHQITYSADFLIGPPRKNATDPLTAEHVVIDAKGMITDVYAIKKKLFLRKYDPVSFLEIKRVLQLEDIIRVKPWTKPKLPLS